MQYNALIQNAEVQQQQQHNLIGYKTIKIYMGVYLISSCLATSAVDVALRAQLKAAHPVTVALLFYKSTTRP